MQLANRAPIFACMYPGLCDVARSHGYAFAIHGSVVTDLDLIAVPWVTDPKPVAPDALAKLLMDHISACGYADLLRRQGLSEDLVQQILALREPGSESPERKPHGRLAWNLYLEAGARVDLSILPITT